MPDFNKYLTRHGEFAVQAIIERLERYEGMHNRTGISLEDRWNALMQNPADQQRLAA